MHDIGFLPISDMLIFYNSLWPIQIYLFLFGKNLVSPVQKFKFRLVFNNLLVRIKSTIMKILRAYLFKNKTYYTFNE